MRRFSTVSALAGVILTVGFLCAADDTAPSATAPARNASHAAEPKVAVSNAEAGKIDSAIDFDRDIRPIFSRSCYSCHGPDKAENGLRLDRKTDAARGGDSGPAFLPGKSGESRLIGYVTGVNDDEIIMPPEGQRLSRDEIGRLRAWIDQGATWPAGSDAKRGSDHWSFQPLKHVEPPAVKHGDWVRNGIDAFVLAKLEQLGLSPSPEADRATLIRRLSMDLLGLPPSPGEVADFVADTRPDAYERLVERLLASPHYGERWGRHWLDLARYADSDGYEKDSPRPYAWRYRQWVIDALNRDMPFDQFTIEQLAGDLLPDATTEQRVATGFHRNTLLNKEGGADQEEFRVAATIDRVNTTGTVWLGLTIGCAQCHSHKYDPISQREFYGMYAFFNSLQDVDIAAPLPEQMAAYRRAKRAFNAEHAPLTEAVARFEHERMPASQAAWERAQLAGPIVPWNVFALAAAVPDRERTPRMRAAMAELYGKLDPDLLKLKRAVAEHRKRAPVDPSQTVKAQTLAELHKPRPTHLLLRGDFLRPGEEVTAHTPEVLHPLHPRGARPDRLDLARWLVDPANPLTARVTVNRIWQRYFGRGLVATSNDMGTQGERPSHPELLDWLAGELVARSWSLKAMHRLIVGSATYRQSSRTTPDLLERDPYNTLLARQSRVRVDAEVVRDLALAASGLLNPKVGGPSVRPQQPSGVAELGYAGSVKWKTSNGADRYRRGMYTFFQRTVPYPMLMTFDAPDSNATCTRRERSNTPLQALTLLNDPVFVECAQALARRIVRDVAPHGNDTVTADVATANAAGTGEVLTDAPKVDTTTADIERRVRYAFALCLAREPSAAELADMRQLYQSQLALCRDDPKAAAQLIGAQTRPTGVEPAELAAWVVMGRTLLNLDEFITRE
jgi:Protein of unknown function (DUF1553)/Protein of unknown function (DUF1549)/Planctomycete cytochrome C